MKRENIEVLLAWLDALRRADRDAMTTMLDPGVVWQGARQDLACHGPEEVSHGFGAALDEGLDVEALELIGADAHAVLHATLPEPVEVADIVFAEGVYNAFAIADGKITRIDDYTRRCDALAAVGLKADC